MSAPSGRSQSSIVFAVPLDAEPAQAPRASQTMSVNEGVFSPPIAVVAVGDTLQFTNPDSIHHRVFSSSAPNAFDLGAFPPSTSSKVQLDSPGVVRLYCSLHERERGIVFVAPTSFFDLVGAPGTFAIDDLAPGSYDLGVFSEAGDGGSDPLRVMVNAGRATSVDLTIADGVQAE